MNLLYRLGRESSLNLDGFHGNLHSLESRYVKAAKTFQTDRSDFIPGKLDEDKLAQLRLQLGYDPGLWEYIETRARLDESVLAVYEKNKLTPKDIQYGMKIFPQLEATEESLTQFEKDHGRLDKRTGSEEGEKWYERDVPTDYARIQVTMGNFDDV